VQLIHWSSPFLGYKGQGTFRIKLAPRAQSGDSGGPAIAKPGVLVGVISGGELAGWGGQAVDTHGAYATPVYNLLNEIDPRAISNATPVDKPEGGGEQSPQQPQPQPQIQPRPQPRPLPGGG
jgi:hypothetical protein